MNPDYRANDMLEFVYKYDYKFEFVDSKKESTEYRRMEDEWEVILNNIDIKFIEKYLRKKKIEKLNKEK